MLKKIIVLSFFVFLSACATRGVRDNHSPDDKIVAGEVHSFRVSDLSTTPSVQDPELDKIPEEVHPLVDKWVSYFQGRGKVHMERYLSRSSRYEALMKKVLRDNGLPEDLFYIALIESGFSSSAFSKAAAVGYWQFIRGTGKRYGLEINSLVDERRDPVLATQAAADYFKGLYSIFGSWYLAMASYNTGENRVKRMVMKHQTRDFWELVRKKALFSETLNYVPKYIAARMIAKDPAKYGFGDIDYMPAIEFDLITVDQPVNLRLMAEKMNYNYEDLKAFNPKFKGEIAPLKEGLLVLRVPPQLKDQALIAAQESAVEKVEYVADAGDLETYRIRGGDNLSSIAKRYRTTVAYLRDVNDLPRSRKLRVGMRLLVPDRTPLVSRKDRGSYYARIESANKEKKSQARSKASPPSGASSLNSSGQVYHIVQSGDSLYTIAQRYNTSVNNLRKMNNLRSGRLIRVGTRLAVPKQQNDSSVNSNSKSSRSPANNRKSASKSKKVEKKVHVVRRGETLLEIALKYDVTLDNLRKHNRIKDPSSVAAGERIRIPIQE